MDGTWTISELAERAAAALSADGSAQVSGRVRDLPNERLIRWYTTIGLVDPPLGRRGRTALYGPRHLLQLVAVKRRQAAGRSIAEIQLELAAATDATLEEVATGTGTDGAGPAEAEGTPEPGNTPARTAFWTTRPDVSYTSASVADDYGSPDTADAHPSVVQGVRLAPGLTLLLDVPALDGDDLAAIEAAARPLLDELRRRGLLTPAATPAFLPADSSRRSQ